MFEQFFEIYCDGEDDEEFCEFIDKQEDAIEELDKFWEFVVPFGEIVIILLRLKVGVTGNEDELLVPLTIGFLSNTELPVGYERKWN